MCEKSCKGQGNGNGEGECKRITMSIFRTGKIIITGARKMEQIETAYNFLNNILKKHYSKVLIKSKA
jgi:TATA-box binding protein (TBP) (component of TFIID and TFIIIB)